nr:alpha amylase N-terminal ig-like domain-containing protein [Thalassobacillus sp. C254]
MEKASIFHEPKYRDAFAVGPRTVEVKIRTKKHDAISVECIYGDPYNVENGLWLSKSTPMTHKGSCDRFDYWSVFLSPLHKRLRYGFRISNMTDILFYTEKGIFKTAPQDVGSYFCFPFLNQADIFTPPEWARDTVWYQIFPERFANGNPSLNPENTLPWGKTPPSPSNFFGGTFKESQRSWITCRDWGSQAFI